MKEDMDKSKKKRKKGGGILLRIIFIAALVLFLVAAIQLIRIHLNYRAADSAYEDLREEYLDDTDDTEENEGETEDLSWLTAMHQVYPGIVGWIKIPDTNIDYPLMHRSSSDGNTYYLRLDYTGAYSVNGSIFIDRSNSPYMDDAYTIIYGHNMKSGAMFHDIKSFSDPDYLADRPYVFIYVVALGGEKAYKNTYQIFSVHVTDESSSVYTSGYRLASDAYTVFIKDLIAAADYDTGVYPDGTQPVITLSTCTESNTTSRTVVHAVLAGTTKNTE